MRGQRILEEQRRHGVEASGVSHHSMVSRGGEVEESFGDVRYQRLVRRGNPIARIAARFLLEDRMLLSTHVSELKTLLGGHRPVLHAHSPHILGRVAGRTGLELGLPVVYEVRGLWEETEALRLPEFRGSRRYRWMRSKELEATDVADQVVVISEGIRRDLVARGVPPGKISIVPNGADPPARLPEPDPALRDRFSIPREVPIAGYIGSLWELEGLETLVHAGAQLLRERGSEGPVPVPVHLVFVGEGPSRAALESLSREIGISEHVTFVGRVPHDEISAYHQLLDVLVVPRPRHPVTEMVTPIKPLEAMGLARAVLVSDVGGLLELVRDGETGMSFEAGSVPALAAKLRMLLEKDELRQTIGEAARQWILAERSWSRIVTRYDAIYDQAISTSSERT